MIDKAQCRLVDRDVDVRILDIHELGELDSSLSAASALRMLIQLRDERDLPFELVLIGKDGGTKARIVEPEALDAFLSLIDTMPMRRAEIQRRSGANSDC